MKIKLAAIILSSLTIIGCVKREAPHITDTDIIQARSYVIDFEQRMEKVQLMLVECEKKIDIDRYKSCKGTAYDTYGISFNSNFNISADLKNKFNDMKQKAFLPLTTELK